MASEKEDAIRFSLFRADGKLVRCISFAARINRKPAALRVTLVSANKAHKLKAKETAQKQTMPRTTGLNR